MTIILSKSQRKSTPWKNGGGTTAEIAIAPAGAGFDDFDWRISLATIAQSGGFSVFPGIDRTLALVEGAGVALQIDAAPLFHLNADHPLIRFAGEAAVHATVSQRRDHRLQCDDASQQLQPSARNADIQRQP